MSDGKKNNGLGEVHAISRQFLRPEDIYAYLAEQLGPTGETNADVKQLVLIVCHGDSWTHCVFGEGLTTQRLYWIAGRLQRDCQDHAMSEDA